MAKEVAITKRARISKAESMMILAVFGTSVVLGISVAVTLRFVNQIQFNSKVIAEEEKSIANYKNTLKNINALRNDILTNLAANEALSSVSKDDSTACINPTTNKAFTYKEMEEIYNKAEAGTEEQQNASKLIQTCSALRIIPDALPAFKNEEALLASLDKIFRISGEEPKSLSPTGSSAEANFGTNLNTFSVRLSIEAPAEQTMKVLSNIERSIREFSIERATIEWSSDNEITLQAQATAYYMNDSTLESTTKTMKGSK